MKSNNIFLCSPYAIINAKTKMYVKGNISNNPDKTILQSSGEVCCHYNLPKIEDDYNNLIKNIANSFTNISADLPSICTKLHVTTDLKNLINGSASIPSLLCTSC